MGFNRPDALRRVLTEVQRAGVERLYVALDGPRPGRARDSHLCGEARAVVEADAWAPDISLRIREDNLGCKAAVTDALDWFFAAEAEGIVLEDDCLPDSSFFGYCATLLKRYRDDERVWLISGSNLLGTYRPRRSDYFFGDGGIWGWASWRRAWNARDIDMALWGDDDARDTARRFLGAWAWRFLAPRYEAVARGDIDTWDYQWSWTRASQGGLSVIPARNLISNIGFRPDGTHTVEDSWLSEIPRASLGPRLREPKKVRFDRGYQAIVVARESALPLLRGRLGRWKRRLLAAHRPKVRS